MNKFFIIFLLLLATSLNILRFYSLNNIPHGYHVDEYAEAVSLQCMAKEGTGPWGEKNYVFLQQGFGTPKPPTYVYPALLWTKIFGYRVPSLRAFSVFAIVLGIIGLFLLGNLIGGFSAGLWTAIAATISPWSWVLGRLAFESFFAPVCVFWGTYFFFKPRSRWNDVGAGLFFCMAAYFYPPARAFIPLFIVTLWIFEIFINKKSHHWWVFLSALAFPSIPLLIAQLRGELSYRLDEVTIWGHNYLSSIGKTASIFDLSGIFCANFFKHLNPQYLFISGDPDYSHSTQKVGLLSSLDMVAWLILAIGLICWGSKFFRDFNPWGIYKKWLMLFFFCFLLGIVPAALTYLDIPNALRMCLGWPFICLITGLTISCLCQRFILATVLASVLVTAFAGNFLYDYFKYYPDRSKGMFAFWIYDEAQQLKTGQDWVEFLIKYHVKDYHERYYMMNYQNLGCAQSYQVWKNINTLSDQILPKQ